jgi:acyl-CoA reductase-like NAD-dependent aldehyde dehydrogenase
VAEGVLKLRNLVGGEWVSSLSGRVAPVLNPATTDVIALPPVGSEAELVLAIESIRVGNPVGDPALDMGRSSPRQVKHVMAKLG